MAQTGFDPAVNGFRFINSFGLQFPIEYSLPFIGSVALNEVIFGLCGGMCFAALDYFTSHETPPDDGCPENLDKKLLSYLCQRQLDSLSIPVLIKIFDWMLSDPRVNATRMARNEIPKIRRSLDKGSPVVLLLIRVQGKGNPTHNHQVVAIGYDFDLETRDLTIHLYDPNHPGEEPTIKLNLAHSSRGRLNLVQSTGEPLYGFFTIPYKARKNIPLSWPNRNTSPIQTAVPAGEVLAGLGDAQPASPRLGKARNSYS